MEKKRIGKGITFGYHKKVMPFSKAVIGKNWIAFTLVINYIKEKKQASL